MGVPIFGGFRVIAQECLAQVSKRERQEILPKRLKSFTGKALFPLKVQLRTCDCADPRLFFR